MQDGPTAVKEMERCMNEFKLQMELEIGTNVNVQNLDHPSFIECFQMAES